MLIHNVLASRLDGIRCRSEAVIIGLSVARQLVGMGSALGLINETWHPLGPHSCDRDRPASPSRLQCKIVRNEWFQTGWFRMVYVRL